VSICNRCGSYRSTITKCRCVRKEASREESDIGIDLALGIGMGLALDSMSSSNEWASDTGSSPPSDPPSDFVCGGGDFGGGGASGDW